MKAKYSIIFLFCFSFLKKDFAQTWPMPGAHWEYCRGGFGANFRIFEYTKDTIINSTNYQVIDHTNTTSIPYLGAVYTRYSNDTVYRYVQSQEYPFIIFNAQVGDFYSTFRTRLESFADTVCTSALPLEVLNLDTLNFASLPLERWTLRDTLFDDIYTGSFYPPSEWLIAERMGFLNDFPFTPDIAIYGNTCNLGTDAEENYILVYYSDSSYVYNTGWNCSVGINEPTVENAVSVYPNPSGDEITVVVSKIGMPAYLSIENSFGQELYRSPVLNLSTSIFIEKFSAGHYVLKYSSGPIQILKKIIITH